MKSAMARPKHLDLRKASLSFVNAGLRVRGKAEVGKGKYEYATHRSQPLAHAQAYSIRIQFAAGKSASKSRGGIAGGFAAFRGDCEMNVRTNQQSENVRSDKHLKDSVPSVLGQEASQQRAHGGPDRPGTVDDGRDGGQRLRVALETRVGAEVGRDGGGDETVGTVDEEPNQSQQG